MVSLTGKPPFATDEPDSFYESATQPQRRLRQPPPPDPNERTSAYNLYDNYLGDDNSQLQVQPSSDRNSGMGALGMGLLNMEDSDSEDDDDSDIHPKPNSPPGLTSGSSSKHAALAAATASPIRPNFPPIPQPQRQPPSQAPSDQPPARPPVTTQVPQQVRGSPPPSLQSGPHQHVPQPIAAPRPGYPAPIATLNLARPEPSATPVGRMPNPNYPHPHANNPFDPPPYPQPRSPFPMPASPAPSTPHPLHPSVTPITPAFIRPSKSPAPSDGSTINVKFAEAKAIPRKAIIRGNSEETLLPGRGEKGDDFWRRFSMVAKDSNERKESSWLHKTRSGSNRQTRMVWFSAILILLLIAGGVVLGLFLRRNAPAHQQPAALGGSANNSLPTTTSSVNTPATQGPGQHTSQTSLHVSPTLTLANREPDSSPLAVHPAQHFDMNAAAVH